MVRAVVWCGDCRASGEAFSVSFDSESLTCSYACAACGAWKTVPIDPPTAVFYRMVGLTDTADVRAVARFQAQLGTWDGTINEEGMT